MQIPAAPAQDRRWDEARGRAIIQNLKHLPGATLPILHALQAEFGYVPTESVPLIADALALSQAEVVGVIEFYHDFRRSPGGRHTLKVCRAEACQAMGCEALVEHLRGRLGVEMGETTPDGALTLETVYCLGNCALSPAVLLDQELYGRVTPALADELIETARAAQ
jgi:formate dehydrogenase subunit gamma